MKNKNREGMVEDGRMWSRGIEKQMSDRRRKRGKAAKDLDSVKTQRSNLSL